MPLSLLVQPAGSLPPRLAPSGLTDVRLSIPITKSESGKSFTTASATPFGGPGVLIARLANGSPAREVPKIR